jgi:hypothetical protein
MVNRPPSKVFDGIESTLNGRESLWKTATGSNPAYTELCVKLNGCYDIHQFKMKPPNVNSFEGFKDMYISTG